MLCSVEACERAAYCRGMCRRHYEKAKRAGQFEPRRYRTEGCSVEGCEEPHEARGLCARHYERQRNHGDPSVRTNRDPSVIEDAGDHLRVLLEGKHGGVCLIDSNDQPYVEGRRLWANEDGYVRLKIDGRQMLLTRLLLGLGNGHDDPRQVDHIDGNPLNNRRENLRVVSYNQNQQNKASWGKSGHRNVYPDGDRWRVIVTKNGIKYSGGRHEKLEDAVEAARRLREELFTHNNEDRHPKLGRLAPSEPRMQNVVARAAADGGACKD